MKARTSRVGSALAGVSCRGGCGRMNTRQSVETQNRWTRCPPNMSGTM
jgi:hypothetical protein